MNSASQLGHLPKWQREKALALHEVCREIQRELTSGAGLKQALHDACIRHAGRVLDEGKGKTLSLSTSSLRRHYKAWLAAGEALVAFIPSYKSGKAKMPGELITEFHRLSTLPGVANMSVAITQIKRKWKRGDSVPGLGTWQEWWKRHRKGFALPDAAPEFPISDRAFYRYKPSKAELRWGRKGKPAVVKDLPWITRDYSKLRPGELFTFDDLRLDVLGIDDVTKKPTEITTYIAYEGGCRLIPAIVQRPANAMLKTDVDSLVIAVLQTFGIGRDYTTHLLFEKGTLTMSPPAAKFLERVTEGRIKVHFTKMNSARTYVGAHRDQGTGHWMGKGVIESLMRKIHLALMMLPGQRGNQYQNQPASLGWVGQGKLPAPGTLAREAAMLAEIEMWEGKRVRLNLGLMWASEIGVIFRDAVKLHNAERGHQYQGFGHVTQKELAPGVWKDIACCN